MKYYVVVSILLDNQEEKLFLEEKAKVLEMVLGEISLLKSKNANAFIIENDYKAKLEEIQKKLFFIQFEGKSDMYLECLWKKHKLDQGLSNDGISLDYLEVIGTIAKEEYLNTHPVSEDGISNTIRNIEANIASLVAKKNLIVNQSLNGFSVQDRTLSEIDSLLEEYGEQLNILRL